INGTIAVSTVNRVFTDSSSQNFRFKGLSVATADGELFAGVDGTGIRASNVNFTLLTGAQELDADKKYTAIYARVENFAFEGIDTSTLGLEASAIELLYNKSSGDHATIDFTAVGYSAGERFESSKIETMDGEVSTVAFDASIDVFGLITLEGSISFSVEADYVEIAFTDMDTFVGYSTADGEVYGLAIDNLDLTLKADGDGVSVSYIFADGLAIKAGDILEIEIDAKALSSMILNSEGVLKTGPIGFDIGILKFSGEFAISKTVQTVATEVDDAGNVLATEDVNFLTFGGQNLQTFFGVSGVGLQLSDIDFAFALAVSGFNVRAVLDARVGSVALVGIPMIEISASDIDISMQKSIYGSGDAYNFASSSVALPTGDDGAGGIARHDINMDNELGYHDIALSIGVAKLSVFSILHIEGAISFNISEVDGVSVFQLQATGLTGLVGIRGDSSVALADDSDASGVMINLADFDLQVVKGGTLKYVGASIEKLQVQNLFGLSFGFDAEEAGRTLDLQMHGTTVVLSDLDFNLGGFVKFRGGVAFGMTDVTLYDKNSDNTFEGKALNLGISAEQAQVGTGDAFGTPQTGMGFMMRDVNFAMAAISYKDALNQKLNVTAVKLSAQEIGLYGFGDNFKLQVEGISLDFVQHSQGNPTVIDFSQSYAVLDGNADKYGGLAIQTGGQPVVFQSAQDEVFKLSFRDSLLQISSFVYVKGGVSFELVKNQMMPVNLGELNSVIAKLPEAAREIINAAMDPEKMVRDVVKGLSTDAINALLPADSAISGAVSDMADEALDTLIDSIKAKIEDMIGFKLPTAVYDNGTVIGYNLPMNGFVLAIKDVTAFVGINGPVFAGEPDNGAIGFQVTDLDLAVTFFQPSSIPVVGSWLNFITVKGNMRSAQVIGLDSAITMKIEDAELQLNTFFMTTNIVIGTVPIDPIINVGLQLIQAPFVDYSKIENGTADNGYLIRFGIPDENGNQPTELIDFDDNFIAVDVDYVHLELTAGGAASIQIIGGASFYKRGGEEVILNNGEKIKVWSLGFSLTNGNAFVGYKKYFNDTNGDGRIYRTAPGLVTHVDGTTDTYGADDINKEAIGLAIDDFNIGAVFMREHASLNMFFAAKLSLRGAGLVGVNRKFVYMEIGDITGKSNNDTYQVPSNPLVQVDVNLAFGLRGFTTVVDFSRSGKDEDGNETAYKLGTRSTAMTLDYSTMLIYARANIDFGILDQGNQFDDNGDLTVSALDKSQYLVSAYGQLEFKLTPDEVNLFINVGGSLNIANLFTLDAQATGVLILDNRGLAASFKVSTSLHLETSSGFEILDTAAAVYLDINTTGENIEYRVPVELLSKMGASDRPDNMDDKGVITISNIAPGNTTPSRAYAALRFEGHMSVANGIIEVSDLGAGIIFEVPQGGGVQVRLYATGIAHIGSFAQLGVAIDLSFGTQGVWGNLQLGDPAGNSKILDFGFATLYGGIGISFNSTSSAKTMKGLATDSEGNITGVVDISVPAETLRLRAGVRLDLAGLITAKGSLDVTIDSQGIRGTFQASIDLVLAKADALFIVDIGYGASTYFRAYGDINITIGVSILSVNVNGKLRINTKNEDWSVANGTVKAQSIRVDFSSSADLYILKLNLNGALYVDLANPEVILSGSASGKFLGIFNISGAFLASSKGTVYLAVTAGIGIDISFKIFGWRFTIFKFQISFGIEITTNSHMLGNLDTSGSISAKNATQLMDYYLNLGNGQRAFNGISFLAVGKGELVIMNVGISLTLGMALTPEEFVLFQGSGGSKKPSGDKVNWFDTGASYAGLPSNAVVFDTGASAFDGQKVVFLPGTSRRNDQNELHDELAAYGGFNYTDDIYWLATEQTLASGAGPDSNAAVYGELPSDPAAAAKVAAAADAQNVDWIDMNSDIKSELAFASVPANGDIDDADILLEGHGIDDYDDMKVDPGDPTRHLLQGSDGKYYEYKLFKDGEVDYSITTTTTDSEGNTTTTTTNHTASGSYYKLVATHDSKPDATPPEVPDEASSDDSATKNSKYGRVFAQWKRSDYSFDPASMSGSTMTLNVGSRSGNRGLMTTVESEEYELYRYANGTVEVRTLGQDKKTYSNVNSLSANFGSGADKLTLLGEWDNVTLNIDMGSGEDELDIRSRVAGGTLRGGSGNDVIKFVTATTIYGDGGDDDITQYHKADAMYANTTIYGGAGYSIIQLYGGNNTINVDNDSQTVDVLNGLDGSSIAPANLTVNALNGGNVLVNSGSALAQETINYKIAATATDQNIEIGRSSVDGDGTDEYRIETRSGAIVVDHDVDRLIVDGSGLTGEVGLVALSKSSDMWQLGETGANASENMVYLNFENANVRNELGSIVGSNSALILTTDGLSGQLNTELKEIAVSNTYSGADAEWIGIDIKEKDSLTVLGTANSNAKFNGVNLPMVQDKAGLYTQRGEVRVELLADGSLLRVNEGGNLRVGTDERISSIVTIADDIEIVNNAKIWRMTYGTVTNSQTDARRDIQVAGSSSANAYNLSVDELNRIEGGNQELIIGSANGSHKVTLGNNSNATSTGIAFSNTVHIMTPAQGGHLDIEDDVDVSNGGFWVTGSGNTTVITQDAAEQATSDDADAKVLITAKEISIDDSIKIDGAVELRTSDANGDITLGGQRGIYLSGTNAVSNYDPDTLRLDANQSGDVTIAVELKSDDGTEAGYLDGLEIVNANDVSFKRRMVVTGDVVIEATGTVRFAESVEIRGGSLTILGADKVIFDGRVTVGGDVTIQANNLDYNSNLKSTANGVLNIYTTDATQGIDMGDLGELVIGRDSMEIDKLELSRLSGFSNVIIGNQADTQAAYNAGASAAQRSSDIRVGVNDTFITRNNMTFFAENWTLVDDASFREAWFAGNISVTALGDITLENTLIQGFDANRDSLSTEFNALGAVVAQVGMDNYDNADIEMLNLGGLTVQAGVEVNLTSLISTSVEVLQTGDGDLSLTELAAGGDLSVISIDHQGSSGNISLQTTEGAITLGGLTSSAAGSLAIEANGSSEFDLSITGAMTANSASDVSLAATGALSASETLDFGIATRLEMTAQTNVSLAKALNANGVVDITAHSGDISLDALNNTGDIHLVAGGDVIVNDDAAADIVSDNSWLWVEAGGGFGTADAMVHTSVANLSLSLGEGAYIVESSDLTVAKHAASSAYSAISVAEGSTGALILRAAGDLTLQNNVALLGSNVVRVSGDQVDIQGNVSILDGSMSIESAGDTLVSNSIDLSGATASLSVVTGGALVMTDGGRLQTRGRDIAIDVAGDATLGNLNSAGSIQLAVDGNMTAASASNVLSAADQIDLQASQVGTAAASLTLNASAFTLATTGDAYLDLTNASNTLAQSAASVDVDVIGDDASVSAWAPAQLGTVGAITGGDLRLDAGANALRLSAAINTSGNLLAQANTLTVEQHINAGAVAQLTVGTLEQAVSTTISATQVMVEADALAQADSASISADEIWVKVGDIELANITADTAVIEYQSVVDAGDTHVDLVVSDLRIFAGEGASFGATDNAIETSLDMLSGAISGAATMAETDDLRVVQSSDVAFAALNVDMTALNLQMTAATGLDAADLTLSAGGNVDADANVSATALKLTAAQSIRIADNVVLSVGSAALNATAGNITLAQAATEGKINATGTLALNAAGDIDLGYLRSEGEVSLTAGGNIVDGDSAVDVMAQRLTLQAAQIGASADHLETQVELLGSTSSGDVFITESGSLTVSQLVTTGAGNVSLQVGGDTQILDGTGIVSAGDVDLTVTGDLLVGRIQSADTVTLIVSGDVRDGEAALDITAKALILDVGAFGSDEDAIELAVETLSGDATAGLNVDNTGDLVVEQLASTGDMTLAADGDLSVGTLEAANIDLDASGAIVAQPLNHHITAQHLALNAGLAIGEDGAMLQTTVDALSVEGAQSINLNQSKDLAIVSVVATDSVHLVVDGNIADHADDNEVDFSAARVDISTSADFGASDAGLELLVDVIDIESVGAVVFSTLGDSLIEQVLAGTVADLNLNGTTEIATIQAADIQIDFAGQLNAAASQDAQLIAASLSIDGAGDVGREDAPLNTAVDTLNVVVDGDVYLLNSQSMTAELLEMSNGTIDVSAGDLTVERANVDTATLTSAGNVAITQSLAQSLTVNAGGNVGIEDSTAQTLTINAAGNVDIASSRAESQTVNTDGHLTIDDANGGLLVVNVAGNAQLNASVERLQVLDSALLTMAQTGDLQLLAINADQVDLTVLGNLSRLDGVVTADSITLDVSGDIGAADSALQLSAATADLQAANADLNALTALTLNADVEGVLQVTSTEDLTVGAISAKTVKLEVANVLGTASHLVSAETLQVTTADVGGNVDATALNTAIKSLELAVSGQVVLSNQGDMVVSGTQSAGSSVSLSGSGAATLQNLSTEGEFVLSASGLVSGFENVQMSALTLDADQLGSEAQRFVAQIDALSATLQSQAWVELQGSSHVQTLSASAVNLSVEQDLQLGQLETTGGAELKVGGAIIDTDADLDITASRLMIQAGIDAGSADNPLEVNVELLESARVTDGGLYLSAQSDLKYLSIVVDTEVVLDANGTLEALSGSTISGVGANQMAGAVTLNGQQVITGEIEGHLVSITGSTSVVQNSDDVMIVADKVALDGGSIGSMSNPLNVVAEEVNSDADVTWNNWLGSDVDLIPAKGTSGGEIDQWWVDWSNELNANTSQTVLQDTYEQIKARSRIALPPMGNDSTEKDATDEKSTDFASRLTRSLSSVAEPTSGAKLTLSNDDIADIAWDTGLESSAFFNLNTDLDVSLQESNLAVLAEVTDDLDW
ncbi:MAG: hypothetical protein HWE20_05350, partial [Gammaproteobacteria bacterium]|nr:hypothetical protein [Gammaproteobacteria bacterium]